MHIIDNIIRIKVVSQAGILYLLKNTQTSLKPAIQVIIIEPYDNKHNITFKKIFIKNHAKIL